MIIFHVLNEDKENYALRIVHTQCCAKSCTRTIDMNILKNIVVTNLNEIETMTRKERRLYLRQKVAAFVEKVSSKNYICCSYKIGDPICHGQVFPVCRYAFRLVYKMTKNMLETFSREIKNNHGPNEEHRGFSDCTAPEFTDDQAEVRAFVEEIFGIKLSHVQNTAMQIRNSTAQLYAYGWLNFYFKCVGDEEPNTHGEIHLDNVKIKDIYLEYKEEMEYLHFDSTSKACFEVLDPTAFATLWRTSFPHVKIRQYKAVSGKCATCAKLSKVRKESKCKKVREYVTYLFSLHRTLLMGERMSYHDRITESKVNPSRILSLVSDGMAQTHCVLPWLANLAQFPKCLPQHIQCVHLHSRHTFLYRTFHNVTNTSNLQIHTFLLSLEYVIKTEGKKRFIFKYRLFFIKLLYLVYSFS
jgi:hypothetical protein